MKQSFRFLTGYSGSALLGMSAVILGALGAHYLRDKISVMQMGYWEKAVHYQFWHVLAILLCAQFESAQKRSYRFPVNLFYAGIFLFSGSLYGLALSDYHAIPKWLLGPMTPIGGICWVVAWGFLALRLWEKQE